MNESPQVRRFPFVTAVATLASLFLFLGIMLYIDRLPNPLGDSKAAPAADPDSKLSGVRARNQAVLDGQDPSVKMSVDQSAAALLDHAEKSKSVKKPHGSLPFPTEAKKP